jgi:4-aminobutyrate aminotransferase-like enzyme/Ser/Thr protein kinase RdoA (MazF antagonist)
VALLKQAPSCDAETATSLAWEIYGIRASANVLPSERDQNFLLQADSGERFVLKLANALDDRPLLEAENLAMEHVGRALSLCPRAIPAKSGNTISEFQPEAGTKHLVRLLTYLPGVPFASIRRHSPELLFDLGRKLGQLDRALGTFDHPAIHRDFHWDLAKGLRTFNEYERQITDSEMCAVAGRVADDFEHKYKPLLSGLRRSVIHNDANDYNVIVGGGVDLYSRNQSVAGLVDFGDMVHSYTVAELAVAIAYAVLDQPEPLAAAACLVKGYHSEHPLQESELAALFGLVCMRLCMSICIAAHQQKQRPLDNYLAISQQPIRDTLPRLLQIHPHFAEAAFRNACGLEPAAATSSVTRWLQTNSPGFASVLDFDVRKEPCIVLDLSIASPLLESDFARNSEPVLTSRLFGAMRSADVKLAVGRYDEPRLLYATPLFATGTGITDERRVIHIGIDLFVEPGSPVYAPLDGTIYIFAHNKAALDYGPVIILKHTTDDGIVFFTLYGHLSEESLDGLSAGKAFKKGERLATIGTSDVNGGWTPHLHFQITTDLLDFGRDFPGVVRASEREIWLSLSPDPNLILGIPADRFPAGTPSKPETLSARRERIGGNLSIAYREPLKIVRGWMQYLFDENGRRYIDAYNNVPHVGHCHPKVVSAASEQMALLNTNTRYLHDLINQYAESLCSTLPARLKVCFFVNSGSEANELALRLARAHTGQRDMIVLEAAYHGNTTTLIDISPYKHNGPGGNGPPDWVHTVPIPDVYRGQYKRGDPDAGAKYAAYVSEAIERLQHSGRKLAGYIAESLPSVGGQIVFPEGYLSAVYAAVRQAGGVCIADEVQTGYGRIGTHFWGFEMQGVVPDIVVLGKPIGNGHPLGAVITSKEIAESFNNGMEFFSTFGGNTVSCAIGLAALKVVLEENLQSHSRDVGNHLLKGLGFLAQRYPIMGDVRGSGLFLGAELVRDAATLEPAVEEASFINNRMRERGILLGTDGPYHNVIKIRPPMPFSEGDADCLLAFLGEVLGELP